MKLDKLGENLEVTVPKTTWIKFSFILLVILLMVVHVILAYSNSKYWEKDYPNYSLVIILFIVNYTIQLHIIVREVKKCEVFHLGSLIYWGIIALSMLIETVVVEVTQR
jgi:hypothetical protein